MRKTTADALFPICEHAETLPILLALLDDSEYYIRRAAAKALATVKREEAVPELLDALRLYYPPEVNHNESIFVPLEGQSLLMAHIYFPGSVMNEKARIGGAN